MDGFRRWVVQFAPRRAFDGQATDKEDGGQYARRPSYMPSRDKPSNFVTENRFFVACLNKNLRHVTHAVASCTRRVQPSAVAFV